MEEGPLLHVYCDESRQTQDRYMVLGGIIVHARAALAFDQAMALWRNAQNMLAELKWVKVCTVLNRGIRKRYQCDRAVVRNVQAVDSKTCNPMQIADVLMGAVGYQNNDCQVRPGARKAKIELADYIARKANLLSLKQNTPRRMRHFGIWLFRFGGRKKETP